MQNLPDKGVSGSAYYLKAEYTVTGLTESVQQSQGRNRGNREAFPILGTLSEPVSRDSSPAWNRAQLCW